MRGSIKLGRIAGIEIGIHYTWIFALIFFTWIFSAVTFPALFPGWATSTYWVTGVIVTVLLFCSVLIHELCHSLVARSQGMKVSNIVLFIFGGVSNIENEPERAGVEFIMAAAGPASSVVLGIIFYLIAFAMTGDSLFVLRVVVGELTPGFQLTPAMAIVSYLSFINIILAIFNIIPAFPLDGGRVLRSIIWGATRNLYTATMIAGNIGRVFGWAMILFGIAQVFGIGGLQASILNGVWLVFIGWFLTSAADSSMREMSLQRALAGVTVKEVMDPAPECVSPAASIQSIVHDAFIQRGRRALPVCTESGLLGIVTLADVKRIPQDQWSNTPVQQIMTPSNKLLSVNEKDDLNGALKVLAQNGLNQIPVMSDGHMVGLLSRADVLRYLQTRQELGIKKDQSPKLQS